MTLLCGTFTELEQHNPAALAAPRGHPRRRAGYAKAQALRDAEEGEQDDWLYCDVETFMRYLEAIEKAKGIEHAHHNVY